VGIGPDAEGGVVERGEEVLWEGAAVEDEGGGEGFCALGGAGALGRRGYIGFGAERGEAPGYVALRVDESAGWVAGHREVVGFRS
jgi:hypothetical protein